MWLALYNFIHFTFEVRNDGVLFHFCKRVCGVKNLRAFNCGWDGVWMGCVRLNKPSQPLLIEISEQDLGG